MSSMMQVAKEYPFLLLVLIPVLIGVYWHRISLGVLRLSQQRTRRLYQLMTKSDGKKVHPLALQLAVADAFKRQIDDRAIQLALARHQPLRLLSDYRHADGIVAVSEDGTRFEDRSRWRIVSRRATFFVLFALAMIPWVVATASAQFQWLSPANYALFALIGLFWTPFVMRIAFATEAARWLIFDLDKRYPPLRQQAVAASSRGGVAGNGKQVERATE